MAEAANFVKVASEQDIQDGTVRVVEAAGRKVALCKWEGQFYAIDDRCTHDNGPLGEGELIDGEVECPRHGARFDIKTGQAMCLPAVGKVSTYPVEIRNGEIWLGLPK